MTGCYDVHGLTVETAVDLQLPEAFRAPITMPAVVTVGPDPDLPFPVEAPKRSGVFRYGTDDATLYIEYKTPVGAPRLAISSLGYHPSVRYTPAFERHGDIVPLARAVYRLKLLQTGWPLVHAGAVERDGSAALITAPPDHGKTSTVLSLLGDGRRFLADDHVLLSADGEVRSYPRPVNLSPFTLTGPLQRRSDPVAKVKRAVAASRFELLAGLLGVEMGERKPVPARWLAERATVDSVFVLAGGEPSGARRTSSDVSDGSKDGVTPIDAEAAARQMVTATLDEFDPFGHYALLLYAHAFDVPIANAVGDLQAIVRDAVADAECYRVGATDVAEYPELIADVMA